MVRYLHTRDIPKFRVCDLLSLFLFFFFPTDHRIILKHINHSECFLRDNQTCHIQFIFECLFQHRHAWWLWGYRCMTDFQAWLGQSQSHAGIRLLLLGLWITFLLALQAGTVPMPSPHSLDLHGTKTLLSQSYSCALKWFYLDASASTTTMQKDTMSSSGIPWIINFRRPGEYITAWLHL